MVSITAVALLAAVALAAPPPAPAAPPPVIPHYGGAGARRTLEFDQVQLDDSVGPYGGCPNYEFYSRRGHHPLSGGKNRLPFQRPKEECRTFQSDIVEKTLKDVSSRIKDLDVARLFENAWPNTLDTTVKYHRGGERPLSFIVTGDIDAMWLRDSHRQLSSYIPLCGQDEELKDLILGAIALQARYIRISPHCNAFHPPQEADVDYELNNEKDKVFPPVSHKFVFECKYELDSLASFLALGNEYYAATKDTSFTGHPWVSAVETTLEAIENLTIGSINETTGAANEPPYRFQRWTDLGTETMPNRGWGNPVRATGMIRSFFRPSDDATIYQFLIPANAQMSVELARLAAYAPDPKLADRALALSNQIKAAIYEYGVKTHPIYGDVFAYEVDGFGSSLFMDDANLPSLLSLPDMGFVEQTDKVYQNTRKMIMTSAGNPYYMKGEYFEGIGGPHVGVRAAWPLSRIVAMRTSSDITEIRDHLRAVVNSTQHLGLIHESIQVDTNEYSRPWFAWANSEFGKAILDLDHRKLLEKATENLI